MCLTDKIKAWLPPLFLQRLSVIERGPLGGLTTSPKTIIEYTSLTPSVGLPTKYFPHWGKKTFQWQRHTAWVCTMFVQCCVLAVQCSLYPRFCEQREDLVQDHKGLSCNYTSVYPVLPSSITERVNKNFVVHKVIRHFLENTGPGQLSGRSSLLESTKISWEKSEELDIPWEKQPEELTMRLIYLSIIRDQIHDNKMISHHHLHMSLLFI